MDVTLIGMPGVGKSTIAAALRDLAAFNVVELDAVIEENEGMPLPEFEASHSSAEFKQAEANAIMSIPMAHNANRMPRVISTGGSVVYCSDGMDHLRSVGPAGNLIVHLEMDYETLYERTGGFANRGVVFNGKTPRGMFEERAVLYEQYRHVAVDCRGQSVHETAAEVLLLLRDARATANIGLPVLLRRAASCYSFAKEDNDEQPVRRFSLPSITA